MAMTASVLLSVLSSCRDSRVIDEEDMAKIYAEMLMTDQWIRENPEVKNLADTTLVYEPILKKYGYTSENYRYSVNYYLDRPKDFAEIMKMTTKILDARKSELLKERERLDAQQKTQEYIKSMASHINLDKEMFSVKSSDSELFDPNDSLTIQWDSLSYCFRINRIHRVDSLSVSDTLSVVDTLVKTKPLDSIKVLPKMDTLKAAKAPKKGIMKPMKIDNKSLQKVKSTYLLHE